MDLNVNTSQAIKATERFFDLLDKILDKNYILETTRHLLDRPGALKVESYLSNVITSFKKARRTSKISKKSVVII
jgi:hypothetical protein